ncbi:MAG TPA: hypothetical protein DDW52_09035 [Planctomycetaceae bacterium]|nr:hypothetical protein [Planctomycetaceae bacterium]
MSNTPDPFGTSNNPYSAPVGASQDPSGGNVEQVRKQHLSHEASIQGMGMLFLLGGVFGILAAVLYVGMGIMFLVNPRQGGAEVAIGAGLLFAFAVFAGIIGAFQFWTGLGLRRLSPTARIPGIILAAIGLLGFPIGTIISGYFLYLLASQKGAFVFSPEYANIRNQTPHIRYKTSIIVWIFLILLLAVIGLGVVASIFASFQ